MNTQALSAQPCTNKFVKWNLSGNDEGKKGGKFPSDSKRGKFY